MKEKLVGVISVPDGWIDVSDPSYDRTVWCRLNDIQVMAGLYDCWIVTVNKDSWGERVAEMRITRKYFDASQDRTSIFDLCIGEIGIDSGQACFWNHKPDFTEEEYEQLSFGRSVQKHGFIASSGFGDGSYYVYARKFKGEIYQLKIKFIDVEEIENDFEDDIMKYWKGTKNENL